jgi:hypothetical protein
MLQQPANVRGILMYLAKDVQYVIRHLSTYSSNTTPASATRSHAKRVLCWGMAVLDGCCLPCARTSRSCDQMAAPATSGCSDAALLSRMLGMPMIDVEARSRSTVYG